MQTTGPSHGDLVRAKTQIDGTLSHCPAGLCGMCQRFAREDDKMEAMRIYVDDIWAAPFIADWERTVEQLIPEQDRAEGCSQSACYMVCRDCREKWKPIILARLKRLKIVPETMTVRAMSSQMLA
jgi:hypothetical protein